MELQTLKWVFAGWRFDGKDLSALFHPIADDGGANMGRNLWFTKKVPARCVAGGIYEVLGSDGGEGVGVRAVLSSLSFQGKLLEHPDVPRWEVESEAAKVAYRLRRLEARFAKQDLSVMACLKPLRSVYFRLAHAERRALEMMVLRSLRACPDNGRGLDT